jgi:hypothetical protein
MPPPPIPGVVSTGDIFIFTYKKIIFTMTEAHNILSLRQRSPSLLHPQYLVPTCVTHFTKQIK